MKNLILKSPAERVSRRMATSSVPAVILETLCRGRLLRIRLLIFSGASGGCR